MHTLVMSNVSLGCYVYSASYSKMKYVLCVDEKLVETLSNKQIKI